MGKPILCVDFDGVIHSYTSGWKGADVVSDPPVPGALAFLREATDRFDVCIYSSRSSQAGGVTAMVHAMERWDIGSRASPSMQDLIEDRLIRFPAEKPAAFLTLDDRAICFTGTWPSMAEMLAFKPWNKP